MMMIDYDHDRMVATVQRRRNIFVFVFRFRHASLSKCEVVLCMWARVCVKKQVWHKCESVIK